MGAEFVEAQGYLTHNLDLCDEAPAGAVRVDRRSECEDNAFGLFRTADGRVASVHSSWTQWRGYLHVEIVGTKGSLVIDNDQIQGHVSSHVFERHGEPIATTMEMPALAKPDPSWRRHLQELLDAIREDRDPVPGGSDGLRATRMVHALYRSAASATAEPNPGRMRRPSSRWGAVAPPGPPGPSPIDLSLASAPGRDATRVRTGSTTETPGCTRSRGWALLVVILLVALGLRVYGLRWALPGAPT